MNFAASKRSRYSLLSRSASVAAAVARSGSSFFKIRRRRPRSTRAARYAASDSSAKRCTFVTLPSGIAPRARLLVERAQAERLLVLGARLRVEPQLGRQLGEREPARAVVGLRKSRPRAEDAARRELRPRDPAPLVRAHADDDLGGVGRL